MKTVFNISSLLAIAACVFSCMEKEIDADASLQDNLVPAEFYADSNPFEAASKASLTPDDGDTSFQAAWDDGDKAGIYYLAGDSSTGVAEGTWSSDHFAASLPDYKGNWTYDAVYPLPDASDNYKVDFGSVRTQNGNSYNSVYDLMEAGEVSASNASAGKDDSGNNIIFHFSRKTAIAYFHLTSDNKEAITSATLTVVGGYIANTDVRMDDDKAFSFGSPAAVDRTITVTFPDSAPTADDFKLWFNVLPTEYTSMSLTVETATKTCIVSRSSAGSYEAGKLYKVKKTGLTWNAKPIENFTSSNATSNYYDCGSYLSTEKNRKDFDFDWYAGTYVGTVFKNGVKLGNSDTAGSLSSGKILTGIPDNQAFYVKIYSASYGTDGASVSVSYNGCTFTESPANGAIEKVKSVEYKSEDFSLSNDFIFTKASGQDTLTIASSKKRIFVDKLEIVPINATLSSVDFEKSAEEYTEWTFTNMLSKQEDDIVSPYEGSYIGTTGGKETASIATKNTIAFPKSITYYVSKASDSTATSTWMVQCSSDGKTWTDVSEQSAVGMKEGEWVKVTQDLSSYSNVYVRVYYSGTAALRTIDNLILLYW